MHLAVCFGQLRVIPGKPRPLTVKEEKEDEKNLNCFYKPTLNAKQRSQFYPFNQAVDIKLVSFTLPDSLLMGGEVPMKGDNVDFSKLKEVITLNKVQVDTLTDILYNQRYGGPFYTFGEGCYYPRNAILFIDSKGESFAFIELCFECFGFKVSSNKIKAGDFCNQKYELLRAFFVQRGITIGTVNSTE
jgi:hypothetical protein